MPFIHTKTNTVITPAMEESLKAKLGKAIELIPGKSETWLMLQFSGECHLWFRGEKDDPIAFVEIMVNGSVSDSAYDEMTAAVIDIIGEELDIAPDHIYVEYQVASKWGWNGMNF